MTDSGVGIPGDLAEMPEQVAGPLIDVGGVFEDEEENGSPVIHVISKRQKPKSKKQKKGRR